MDTPDVVLWIKEYLAEQTAELTQGALPETDVYKRQLTPYDLRELVKGVYIEAPDKSSGKRRQNIRISYDLVGFIPLNELMNEETA